MVKNLSANGGGKGDVGSIPELGRSPGGGNGNLLHIFSCEIPGTEEPGGLQSIGSQRDLHLGFPGGSDGKESTYRVRDPGLISGLGRSPG